MHDALVVGRALPAGDEGDECSTSTTQPWAFIAARRGDEVHTRLIRHLAPSAARWAPSASILVVNLCHRYVEGTDWDYSEFALYDVGQAVAHMTIQAQSLGLFARQFRAFDRDALALEFDVPDHWQVTTISAFGRMPPPAPPGYQAAVHDFAGARSRRPLSQLRWLTGEHRRGGLCSYGDTVDSAVNLDERFARFTDQWMPRVIARLNDYEVKIVRLEGEFVWHAHADTDELFLVIDGNLTIQLRDRDVTLGAGDLYVVPKGVEHCPRAEAEVRALLLEPRETVNTGDAGGGRTVAAYDDSLS